MTLRLQTCYEIVPFLFLYRALWRGDGAHLPIPEGSPPTHQDNNEKPTTKMTKYKHDNFYTTNLATNYSNLPNSRLSKPIELFYSSKLILKSFDIILIC